jgi:hypothetical protein
VNARPPTIALVLVWFGPWPFWLPAFLLSCRHNPGVRWLVACDASPPASHPDNVTFLPMDIVTFNRRSTAALGLDIRITPDYAYKLCDLKIMNGLIFEDELREFDFWGCCDLDVVWGNILKFITPDLLDRHDVITSRPGRISGHFCLFRNLPEWVNLFHDIPDIGARLAQNARYTGIDESGLTALLQGYASSPWRRIRARFLHQKPVPRVFWERTLTTNGKHQRLLLTDPALRLVWREGCTYNAHGQEMMYLHFHAIRKTMQTLDFGADGTPREFVVTPRGIFATFPEIHPTMEVQT